MFNGVYSVLPTPFTLAGELDLQSFERVIELYIRAGVKGLTALGVTSETTRLSETEKIKVLETVIHHVKKRVPVIIGTSTEGLRTCIDVSQKAKEFGAGAVMVSPPRMPKLNSDAVVDYYRKLAEAVDIPIVVQDYPPISGFAMEASLLVRIAKEIPQARTIKLEDPPTPLKIARVLEQAEGMQLSILGGLGGMFFLEELMAGASGTMTGFAIPEILVNVVEKFQNGGADKASEIFYSNVALMRFEFQEGIGMAIRKEILCRRGAMGSSYVRPPGAQLDASTRRALDSMIQWFLRQHKELAWTLD